MVGLGWNRVRPWAAWALLVAVGCGQTNQPNSHGSGGSNAGVGGQGMAGKAASNSEAGSAGDVTNVGGAAATAGSSGTSAGTGGTSAGGDTGGVGGQSAGSGGGGTGGQVQEPSAIQKVKPSPGCGKDAQQALGEFVMHTIQTSGVKEANCAAKLGGQPKCGPWSLLREYHLWLPPAYAKDKPYPLVVQGPGCGANGTNVYSLSPTNTAADAGVGGTVIRVGLTPPPNSIGHGTNENQGCFDDKEGDDSVDFVFYEKLLDQLKTELCYDENRVFVNGNSSGSWLANELVVKYAGDTKGHAVRGIIANTGGLPTEPAFTPTPSGKPYAGVWVVEVGDQSSSFSGWKYAVSKAMQVGGCEANSFDAAQTTAFPVGGGALATSCKRIEGCNTLYPLIVCALPGNGHGAHDETVNPAAATFLDMLAAP